MRPHHTSHKLPTIGCIYLALLAALHHVPAFLALPLAKESFSIESKVHVFSRQVGQQEEQQVAEVSEAYSFEQRRAKLSLFMPSVLNYDQLYKDFWYQPGQLIAFTPGTGECFTSDKPEAISEALKFDFVSVFETTQAPEYVVGPARLLFFIEEHKSELKLTDLTKTYLERNIPCLMYTLSYTDQRSKSLNIKVFYTGSSLTGGDQQQLPVRVIIESDSELISIGYSRVRVLKMDYFSEALSETSDAELPDDFIITSSCVFAMNSVDLFSRQDLYGRFSFDVEVTLRTASEVGESPQQVLQMSSVYDSKLGLLRLKRHRTPTGQTILHKTLDFKRGLSYRTEEKGRPGETVATSCLVYKTETNLYATMGQVLLGGNEFVHLGKAKYRGLNTNVYKSKSAQLPLWVENPIEYTTIDGEVRVHSATQKPDGSVSLVSIVLHMSDDTTPVPVLMTVNHDGFIQRFNFYNFAWDINHSGRELFSLANMCSSQSKKAQVELVLQTGDARMTGLKLPNSHLESSLLAILQSDYFLPVVMVHELELRKINSTLFVEFTVADHQKQVSDLVFIGYGKSEDYRLDYNQVYRKQRTFNTCAQIATRTASEVTFGWSQEQHTCIVEEGYKTEPAKIRSFSLSKSLENSNYEVFSIRQRRETDKIRASMAWLDETSWIKRKLMNDTLVLFESASNTSGLYFNAQQFITKPVNMLNAYQNGTGLVGLGLSKEDAQSWQVKSRDTKEQVGIKTQTMAGAMSLQQCRAKCLENADCQSYSICQQSADLECLNSRRNFTNQKLNQQLLDGSQRGTFKVDLGPGEQMTLVRRPHCSIYNKLYMDLFKQRNDLSTVVFPGQLLSVFNREECAQRCSQVNAEVLAEDSKIMLRISTIYMSYLPEQDLEEMHELLAERRNIRRKICNGFYFVPESSVNIYLESGGEIDKFLLDPGSSPKAGQVEGYCKLEQARVDTYNHSDVHLRILTNHYAYRFDHLYESFAAINLKATPLSKEQQLAYLFYAGNQGKKAPEGSIESMRNLLDAGYNFQRKITTPDEVTCAAMCISGRLGPWPFCQSFDTEVDEYTATMTCYLNSITLSDAMKSDNGNLVDELRVKGKSRFHYEPRDALALLETTEEKEMMILEQEELDILSSQFRVKPIWSSCIIGILVVAFGYLGLYAGQLVIKMRNEHSTRVPLINVDFINQVTAEGSIR